jgi:hypothetical protein
MISIFCHSFTSGIIYSKFFFVFSFNLSGKAMGKFHSSLFMNKISRLVAACNFRSLTAVSLSATAWDKEDIRYMARVTR